MNKSNAVLLKTLLRSTSQFNISKYTKDKKMKGKVAGRIAGVAVLYVMLMAYCLLSCIGYGHIGMADVIPGTCALTICLMAFLFTFFKTNGYLFNFKEYDMLMALPFSAKEVAGCKFLYMYVKSLLWYLSISISMMVGYGIYAKPVFPVYPLWIVLTLILPVMPMLLASFLGFLVAKISAGFRKNNIIQVILTFIIIALAFSSRFFIEKIIRNDEVTETLENAAVILRRTTKMVFPAGWFEGAIVRGNIVDILLLVGVTILLFELVFTVVGRSYREINSKLKNHAASKKANMTGRRTKSVVNAIAFKEFKRMTGSTVYVTNICIGEIFAVLAGVAALFVDLDSVVKTVMEGAPVTMKMLIPAIPLIIYFFIGMVPTTAVSPSIEGKNYWIVQSLPISKKTLYQGKMLFNMYLTVPFMTFGVVCVCISAGASFITTVLSALLGFALCAFTTTWGCVCGIRHMRLDWENEVEVIKQGSAVAIYMFPNMIATMGLVVLAVFLGTRLNVNLIIGAITAATALLALLCYFSAIKNAEKFG